MGQEDLGEPGTMGTGGTAGAAAQTEPAPPARVPRAQLSVTPSELTQPLWAARGAEGAGSPRCPWAQQSPPSETAFTSGEQLKGPGETQLLHFCHGSFKCRISYW